MGAEQASEIPRNIERCLGEEFNAEEDRLEAELRNENERWQQCGRRVE